ncbi:MAG: TRAP transporter small permease [Sphaerochaetaceae bacterium]
MKYFDRFFSICLIVCFILMVGVVLLQIICRIVPFFKAPAWTEESSRYLMVYVVACSAGLAIKHNSFVAVDTIYHFMKPRKGMILTFSINIFLIIFFIFFFVGSIAFFKLGLPQHSITMPIFAMSVIYLSMPMISAVIILYLVCKEIEIIQTLRVTEE